MPAVQIRLPRLTVLRVLALLALLSVLVSAVYVWYILGQSTNPLFSRRADVTVPELVGLTQEEAETALKEEGLNILWEEVYNPAVDPGQVCAQQPAAGRTVKQGQTLTVSVSLGTQWLTVPDLTGQNRDEALQSLRDQGFSVAVGFLHDNTIEPYTIVRTEPAAGEQLAAGQIVKAVVARPIPDPNRQVPDLVGLSLAEARSRLQERGLTAVVRPSGSTEATVRSQDPYPGALVKVFSLVYLYVG